MVLGQVNLSFYAVTGAVVREVLEALGHEVEVREGSHPEIYPMLGAGEVDLLAASWLPNAHRLYWERYGDRAVRLATLYEGAKFFWAVPSYVPEEEISSVADLTRPEVAERMEKTITGVGKGSGLVIASERMMDEYGLTEAGYGLAVADQGGWVGALEEAVAARRWIAHPLWRPQFLNRAHDLRPLAEPKDLLGGEDRAVLVARKGFAQEFPPETVAALRGIRLGLAGVEKMDFRVNVEGASIGEAAKGWMEKNPGAAMPVAPEE